MKSILLLLYYDCIIIAIIIISFSSVSEEFIRSMSHTHSVIIFVNCTLIYYTWEYRLNDIENVVFPIEHVKIIFLSRYRCCIFKFDRTSGIEYSRSDSNLFRENSALSDKLARLFGVRDEKRRHGRKIHRHFYANWRSGRIDTQHYRSIMHASLESPLHPRPRSFVILSAAQSSPLIRPDARWRILFLMSSKSFALLLAPSSRPLSPSLSSAAANNDNVVTSSPETDLFLRCSHRV